MVSQSRYKIEVKWDRRGPQDKKRRVIALPEDKVTGITLDALVKVIAENGVEIADEIRHHDLEQTGGTRMITRNELFSLWKRVEAFRNPN
jgi:hypothetical protein